VRQRPGEQADGHPLFDHPLTDESQFRAADLVASVRRLKGLLGSAIPEICILEFDGDLTDALIASGEVCRFPEWPCFHTAMWLWESGNLSCGIVARTIGGPFAVLVAEQLLVCGARVVVGITSAGRVSDRMPVPGIVVADSALRDEGTSTHYLPPSRTVESDRRLADALLEGLAAESLPIVRGSVWTTDAPYRETPLQLERYSDEGILAVEMQAASLFAFGLRQRFPVGLVAHVTNGSNDSRNFDKGDGDTDYRILQAVCRGAMRFLDSHRNLRA
jgi:uridine phosphorylase